ncbi:pebp-like protein [Diplodia corticola]|uniref:Pebp-like protein n=1 Tax=Diplodia corticola TaxID=236234 RepID=A0A1J9QN71_9PEZI|nr:pebp-like protein [Diplodia corticola]OJD29912.1 pebp-like protein [Diplodia corticola]
MGILQYIEYYLSRLFYSIRAHDAKLFIKSAAFARLPEPNMTIECSQSGPSGSHMAVDLTQDGKEEFPHLTWTKPAHLDVKEYMLVCEDADAPIPFPIAHCLFYAIPAETTQVTNGDIQLLDANALQGGFRWIPNIRGKHYIGPRPLVGHGPHRYFYELVALSEPLDLQALGSKVGKSKIAEAIKGKVVGWGSWVGVYERTWQP